MNARALLLLTCALGVIACSRRESPREEGRRSTHPWFTSVSSHADYAELPSEVWRPVVADKAKEAEALLQNDEWLELDGRAARHLSGRDVELPGLQPYLLRGVLCSGNREMQRAFRSGSEFWVAHWGMGIPDVAVAAPVIVFHPTPPAALFVSCNFTL